MDRGGHRFLVLFMAYGTQYAFGVFFAALVDEFGWSPASVSGVFSLYALVYSAFALGSGRLTDRWGPRAVISIGGALLGLGPMLMSRVTSLWQPYLLYGTVAALGMSTASFLATPPSPSGSRVGAASRLGWPVRAAASARSRCPRSPTCW